MNDQPAQLRIEVNDNIHLSALRPSDKPALVEYLNDKEIYENTLRIPFPYTEADAESFLESSTATENKQGHPLHFAVRDSSGKAIGGCGFEGLSYGHRTEIGYWLARPFWGRGIMTEVVGALCRFAFAEWQLVRITAHVFLFNDRSARVLEKNGFRCEGVLQKNHCKDGKFLDSKLYALIK